MKPFSLRIVDQFWLRNMPPEEDICSHGMVEVLAGNRPIFSPADGEFTLWAAAVHLLRTLERDHTAESPIAEQLIPCCGSTFGEGYFITCPVGMNWWVEHRSGNVRLWGFVHMKGLHPETDWRQSDAEVTLPHRQYGSEVVAFARSVEAFYTGAEKRFPSSAEPGWCDRTAYEAIWREMRATIKKFGG